MDQGLDIPLNYKGVKVKAGDHSRLGKVSNDSVITKLLKVYWNLDKRVLNNSDKRMVTAIFSLQKQLSEVLLLYL